MALNEDTATKVLDMLNTHPATHKCTMLKDRQIDTFWQSDQEVAAKVLEEELDDL